MKALRGFLLVMLALVVVAVSGYAGGDKAEKLAKLKTELNLTDAQVTQLDQKFAQLDPIVERAKKIKGELNALESATPKDAGAIDAKRAEMTEVKKEYKAKAASIFRSVLNNEQYAKWEAMNAEYEKSHSAKKH
jgi:Spy/CpxP family protein refolding chaperone